MTIRINQTAVDFTLEEETTFADLTASLRAWAAGQSLEILSLLADGRALVPAETSLDKVSLVEIETVPAAERDLARLSIITQFFILMNQGWAHDDQASLNQLHDEFSSVRGALFPLLLPIVSRLRAALTVLDGPWTDTKALREAAGQIATETVAFRSEHQDLPAALLQTLGQLDALLDSLPELGLFFQKGRDKDGFDRILELFSVLEDLNRRALLTLARHQAVLKPWLLFHDDLQPTLREVEGALAAGDYILLTDLIEYELTPRLRLARSTLSDAVVLDPAPGVL